MNKQYLKYKNIGLFLFGCVLTTERPKASILADGKHFRPQIVHQQDLKYNSPPQHTLNPQQTNDKSSDWLGNHH